MVHFLTYALTRHNCRSEGMPVDGKFLAIHDEQGHGLWKDAHVVRRGVK